VFRERWMLGAVTAVNLSPSASVASRSTRGQIWDCPELNVASPSCVRDTLLVLLFCF